MPPLIRKATLGKKKLRLALSGHSKSGKAQPLDAKILTPNGWTTMGNVAVGDEVVNSRGGVSTVTAVHPQGEKPIYRVTFSDRSSTECCEEHLWVTQTTWDRLAKKSDTPKTLREIKTTLKRNDGGNHHFIPMVDPVQFHWVGDRPLDPYLLGVLLGDGCFRPRSQILLTNPEPSIIQAVRELAPQGAELIGKKENPDSDFRFRHSDLGHALTNPVLEAIRELGLHGLGSKEKFIPRPYLLGPIEARVALLQGLMDTDGYSGGRTLEYTTSSPRLAEDFLFLVQSLSGTATVTRRVPKYTHKGERREGALSYRMYVSLPSWIAPFRLPRKADKFIPKTKFQPLRSIESIELVGTKEAQCITVDAPDHLYVTDNFVVTHNSYTSLTIASGLLKYLVENDELGGNPALPGYGRIGVIDTEHSSSEVYAEDFDFDVADLKSYNPVEYIALMKEFEKLGYSILVIDQISHAWAGKGGILEQHAQKTQDSKSKNGYIAWAGLTPIQNALFEAILASPCHVIATIRAKVKHKQLDGGTVVKIGTRPIQRNEVEYEFDGMGMMDHRHHCTFGGSRCKAIDNRKFEVPDQSLGAILGEWLVKGEVTAELPDSVLPAEYVKDLQSLIREIGMGDQDVIEMLARRGAPSIQTLTVADAVELIKAMKSHITQAKRQATIAAKAAADPEPTPDPEPVAAADSSPAPVEVESGISDNQDSDSVQDSNSEPVAEVESTDEPAAEVVDDSAQAIEENGTLGEALVDMLESHADASPSAEEQVSAEDQAEATEALVNEAKTLATDLGYERENWVAHIIQLGALPDDPHYSQLSDQSLELMIEQLRTAQRLKANGEEVVFPGQEPAPSADDNDPDPQATDEPTPDPQPAPKKRGRPAKATAAK